jgi:hypothetical protein
MEDGSTKTLMTVVPVGSDRDFSVAVRAAKVLSTIWRGFRPHPSACAALEARFAAGPRLITVLAAAALFVGRE